MPPSTRVDKRWNQVSTASATAPALVIQERPAFVQTRKAVADCEPATQPLKAAEPHSWLWQVVFLWGTTSLGLVTFVLLSIQGSTGKASQLAPALQSNDAPNPSQPEKNLHHQTSSQTSSQAHHQTTLQARVKPLQQAQTFADRAQLLSQSAQSVDDWKLIAKQWQTAVNVLKAVPRSSSFYPAARRQLQGFDRKLADAARKANQPIVEVPALAKANIVGGEVFCPSSSRSIGTSGQQAKTEQVQPEQPKVELTNVAFEESGSGVETPITGCITNHTNQPITQVSIVYKGTSAQVAGLVETGKEEVISVVVQPGATVGFRSRYTVSPSISTLDIQAISWTVAGQSERQIAAATAQLVR
ncbi:hypothetical protein [Leptolyngbya ohadii]|uniref:hypothetical protein n=1 Tax=Leptolyngbya ohadii TaxID=1962290 RepID=UPI00117B3A10|nr:hypothetical protein [Leptolyngbya ohadii]